MTNVFFDLSAAETSWEMHMTVTGHAGYAEFGKDIVCSACSILVQSLAAALLQICRPEHAPLVFTRDDEQAKAEVWFMAEDALQAERVSSMFDVAKAGFLMLEKAYPENVCVAGANEILH